MGILIADTKIRRMSNMIPILIFVFIKQNDSNSGCLGIRSGTLHNSIYIYEILEMDHCQSSGELIPINKISASLGGNKIWNEIST